MIQAIIFVVLAACTVVNIPGMLAGNEWSFAAFVFCLLLTIYQMRRMR